MSDNTLDDTDDEDDEDDDDDDDDDDGDCDHIKCCFIERSIISVSCHHDDAHLSPNVTTMDAGRRYVKEADWERC